MCVWLTIKGLYKMVKRQLQLEISSRCIPFTALLSRDYHILIYSRAQSFLFSWCGINQPIKSKYYILYHATSKMFKENGVMKMIISPQSGTVIVNEAWYDFFILSPGEYIRKSPLFLYFIYYQITQCLLSVLSSRNLKNLKSIL